MRNVVLYIAASLDGFIADADNELDWLLTVAGEGDNGFGEFYTSVDTVLLGRKTYDWIQKHEGNSQPYADKECYIFSRSDPDNSKFVSFEDDELVRFVSNLKSKPGKDIWLVGGGELISQFINAGLLDEIRVSIAPIILGKGTLLFKDIAPLINLELTNTKQYGQFVELCYNVKKDRNTANNRID